MYSVLTEAARAANQALLQPPIMPPGGPTTQSQLSCQLVARTPPAARRCRAQGHALEILVAAYNMCPYPDSFQRQALAQATQLSLRTILVG